MYFFESDYKKSLLQLPYLSGDPQRGLNLAECWGQFVGGCYCFLGYDQICKKSDLSLVENNSVKGVDNLGNNYNSSFNTASGSSPFAEVRSGLNAATQTPHQNGITGQKEYPTPEETQKINSIPSDLSFIDCSAAGYMLILYVVVNILFNYLGLVLTKKGSVVGIGSVLCSLACAVKLPLSNLNRDLL